MPSKCTCGRSPTGFCEGWHGLDKEEYMQRMREYKEQKAKEAQLNENSSDSLED